LHSGPRTSRQERYLPTRVVTTENKCMPLPGKKIGGEWSFTLGKAFFNTKKKKKKKKKQEEKKKAQHQDLRRLETDWTRDNSHGKDKKKRATTCDGDSWNR